MDWTLIFVALITAVPATLAALGSWHNARKIQEVKHEVVTGNGKTIGILTNEVETRRIDVIPHADRTLSEQEHMDWDNEEEV